MRWRHYEHTAENEVMVLAFFPQGASRSCLHKTDSLLYLRVARMHEHSEAPGSVVATTSTCTCTYCTCSTVSQPRPSCESTPIQSIPDNTVYPLTNDRGELTEARKRWSALIAVGAMVRRSPDVRVKLATLASLLRPLIYTK